MFLPVSFFPCLRRLLAVFLLCAATLAAAAQSAHVNYAQSIVAGFTAPKAIAADKNGAVYVADFNSGSGVYNLYKETPNGGTYTQTVIATSTYQILNLAVDASGNVYFDLNTSAGSIYKLTPAGGSYTQSTVVSGVNALALAADVAGNVFYTDYSANAVIEEKLSGNTYTPSTLASGFNYPLSLSLDAAGDIFVADNNSRVVRLTLSGGAYVQTTVASGLGSYVLNAAAPGGDVFILDVNNYVILKSVTSSGAYTTSTAFNVPAGANGIATDSLGDVFYIASGTVYKETALEGADVPALTYPATNLTATTPAMTATFTFDVGGTLASPAYKVFTQGDPTLDYQPAATQAASVCATGHTYAAGDTCTVAVTFTPSQPGVRYGGVRLLGADSATIAVAYLQGSGLGPLIGLPIVSGGELDPTYSHVFGFAPDSGGNIYVNNASTIYKVRIADGAILQTINTSSSVLSGVALDGAGNLFVTDVSLNVASLLPISGTYDTSTSVATGLASPAGIAVDGSGNVFVVDRGHSRVLKETFVDESYVQTVIGSGMSQPETIAVDSKGNVFISDTGNNRILVETPAANGAYTQSVFPTNVLQPTGLAVDPLDNLFIGDDGNHRILKETLVAGAYVESVYVSGIAPTTDIGYLAVDGNSNLFAEIAGTNTSWLIKYSVQTPATLSYQTTAVGNTSTDSPKTVVLSNLGNAPLVFAVPANGFNPTIAAGFQLNASSTCPQLSTNSAPASLAPNSSCTDVVSFVPVSSGVAMGNLTETDYSLSVPNSSQVVATLYGVGTGGGTPQANLTPSAAFGSVQIGASVNQTITLSNPGTAALPITSATVTAGASQFSLVSTTCTSSLAASASCTYTLSFTPTATGAQTGTFSVTDSVGTQTSSLSGTGLSAGSLTISPTVQAFPATVVGMVSPALTSTISNTTAHTISLSAGSLTDAVDFTQADNCNGVVASGKTCTVTFTFTPKSVADLSATYSIHDLNNAASPLTVTLSGTGTAPAAPQAALTPTAYNFGSVATGSTSPAQTFTLTNAGNAALTITSIAVTGANAASFSLTANTCPTTLAAGSACTMQVTFNLGIAGSFNATLSVVDAVGTQTSALSGTASVITPPDFTLTATPATQSSYRGRSVTYTLQLAPLLAGNPYNSPVTLTASNLPAGATATFSPMSVTPGASPATSVLTVSIPALSGAAGPGPLHTAPPALAVAALLAFGMLRRRKLRLPANLLLLVLSAAVLAATSGCGSGNGFAVPTSTTVITIAGMGPSATHTTTVTLTVQ